MTMSYIGLQAHCLCCKATITDIAQGYGFCRVHYCELRQHVRGLMDERTKHEVYSDALYTEMTWAVLEMLGVAR